MGYFTSKLFVFFFFSHPRQNIYKHFTSRNMCVHVRHRYLVGESGLEPLNSMRDQNPIIRAHSTREHLVGIVDDTTNLFHIFEEVFVSCVIIILKKLNF